MICNDEDADGPATPARVTTDDKWVLYVQCESKKSPPGDPTFFHFFHKWLRICNRFFYTSIKRSYLHMLSMA